jgi:hypothetical protein
MKLRRIFILFLFAIILICVIAVILPQQRGENMAVFPQVASTRQASLTQAALTPTAPLVTDLEEACQKDGRVVSITGTLGLSSLALVTSGSLSGVEIKQGDTKADLGDVRICRDGVATNCFFPLKDDYALADLKGFDSARKELMVGDKVTIEGRVDLSSGYFYLRHSAIWKGDQ